MKIGIVKNGILTMMALLALSAAAFAAPQAPVGLREPEIARTFDEVILIWEKPQSYGDIKNYNVYMDGRYLGAADSDAATAAKKDIAAFYANNPQAQPITRHMYRVKGLEAGTKHTFIVRAVDAKGVESADSNSFSVRVAPMEKKAYNIERFGAVGNGSTSNTRAIQKAIDSCVPGGTVVIPAGVFKTGAVWLKSNMTLEIQKDAVLLGSEDAADYPYHYKLYPYLKDERYYALLNARPGEDGQRLKNIRIIGEGTIDGNGWKMNQDGTAYLYAKNTADKDGTLGKNHVLNIGVLAANEIKALGDAYNLNVKQAYPRRSSLILMQGVDSLYFNGITLKNPANHTIISQNCQDVVVNNVKFNTYNCNNGDGFEFVNSRRLIVMDSQFDTGDDCINFAAGEGKLGAKNPATQKIWIFNNAFHHGHGAVVMGSHTAAFIEKVLAEDNVIDGTDIGLRMKTAPANGGGARNVVFRDNALKNLQHQAFVFTTAYNDPNAIAQFPKADKPGCFYNIRVENCSVENTKDAGIEIQGLPEAYHHDITFSHIKFKDTKPWKISYLQNGTFEDIIMEEPGKKATKQ